MVPLHEAPLGWSSRASLLLQKNGDRSPKGRQNENFRLFALSIDAYWQIADERVPRNFFVFFATFATFC
jgi:hypothetical protein